MRMSELFYRMTLKIAITSSEGNIIIPMTGIVNR